MPAPLMPWTVNPLRQRSFFHVPSPAQPALHGPAVPTMPRLSHTQMSPHKCGSRQHAMLALISLIWGNQVSFAGGSSPLMRGERIYPEITSLRQICKKGSFRPLWTFYLLSSIPGLTTSLAGPSAGAYDAHKLVITAKTIEI